MPSHSKWCTNADRLYSRQYLLYTRSHAHLIAELFGARKGKDKTQGFVEWSRWSAHLFESMQTALLTGHKSPPGTPKHETIRSNLLFQRIFDGSYTSAADNWCQSWRPSVTTRQSESPSYIWFRGWISWFLSALRRRDKACSNKYICLYVDRIWQAECVVESTTVLFAVLTSQRVHLCWSERVARRCRAENGFAGKAQD